MEEAWIQSTCEGSAENKDSRNRWPWVSESVMRTMIRAWAEMGALANPGPVKNLPTFSER